MISAEFKCKQSEILDLLKEEFKILQPINIGWKILLNDSESNLSDVCFVLNSQDEYVKKLYFGILREIVFNFVFDYTKNDYKDRDKLYEVDINVETTGKFKFIWYFFKEINSNRCFVVVFKCLASRR